MAAEGEPEAGRERTHRNDADAEQVPPGWSNAVKWATLEVARSST